MRPSTCPQVLPGDVLVMAPDKVNGAAIYRQVDGMHRLEVVARCRSYERATVISTVDHPWYFLVIANDVSGTPRVGVVRVQEVAEIQREGVTVLQAAT